MTRAFQGLDMRSAPNSSCRTKSSLPTTYERGHQVNNICFLLGVVQKHFNENMCDDDKVIEVDPFNTVTSIFEDNEMEVTANAATETEAE